MWYKITWRGNIDEGYNVIDKYTNLTWGIPVPSQWSLILSPIVNGTSLGAWSTINGGMCTGE